MHRSAWTWVWLHFLSCLVPPAGRAPGPLRSRSESRARSGRGDHCTAGRGKRCCIRSAGVGFHVIDARTRPSTDQNGAVREPGPGSRDCIPARRNGHDGRRANSCTRAAGGMAGPAPRLAERASEASRHRQTYGMRALKSYRPNEPNRPTICLVHGLNSSSGGFVHMIPWLEEAGYGIVIYDYPFNRRLEESCAIFARDWAAFRREVRDKLPWSIVAHSMGAFLARSLVEDDRPRRTTSHHWS